MPRTRAGAVGLLAALAAACSSSAPRPDVARSADSPRSGSAPRQAAVRPRLVVLVTIDQFRADYLTRFGAQLTGGLSRMSRDGASFTNAHHDHAITETAPGHATLLSGRLPRSTRIISNALGVPDEASPLIGGATGDGASPRRFAGTTLVDWLRAADARSKAVSVSLKDRGAILPIGRSKAEVYWYSGGMFTTSRYYRESLPAWVSAFNARSLPRRSAGRVWSLLLPDSAYKERDDFELEGFGRDFVFPHRLPEDSSAAAAGLPGTPFGDEVTLALALHGVTSLALGAGPQTDLLAVSLSATDAIGHRYGPDSREIHDQVLRVDRMLGSFLDSLYRLRDSTRVTIVLTSDHGIATMPELRGDASPLPARVDLAEALRALRAELTAARLDPNAIETIAPMVVADRAILRTGGRNADSVLAAFAAALRREPGVRRVDGFRALLRDTLTDTLARRWSHQVPADANLELLITLTRFSVWGSGNVASHGSPYEYDTHVPLIFYGAGIAAGRHAEPVRTVDLAPTLAALLGIRPSERLDGRPLRSALR